MLKPHIFLQLSTITHNSFKTLSLTECFLECWWNCSKNQLAFQKHWKVFPLCRSHNFHSIQNSFQKIIKFSGCLFELAFLCVYFMLKEMTLIVSCRGIYVVSLQLLPIFQMNRRPLPFTLARVANKKFVWQIWQPSDYIYFPSSISD